MRMYAALALIVAWSGTQCAFGQQKKETSEKDAEFYGNFDSDTTYDDRDSEVFNYFLEEEKQKEAPKKEKRPYVRIIMPFDSIKELITYTEIIEQEDSYVDSLYLRAKGWAVRSFSVENNAKVLKTFFKEDQLYEKITFEAEVPLFVKYNTYSSKQNGTLRFKMIVRFKDGRYKFDVTNLVHYLPKGNVKKEQEYVYLEYYMTAERNIIPNDLILRAADRQVRKMSDNFKRAMREPIEVDEDDW